MKRQSRRDFLRYSCSLATAASFGQFGLMSAFAAPVPGYKALVCIYQDGGNDGHNTLIPIHTTKNLYSDYRANRPDIAITQAALAQNVVSPKSAPSDVYAFHPALKDLVPLFQGATPSLAVLANAGNLVSPLTQSQYQARYRNNDPSIPASLFSHSDQTIQWESQWQANSQGGYSIYRTGWGGRIADLAAQNVLPGFETNAKFPMNIAVSNGAFLGLGQHTVPTAIPPGFNPSSKAYQIGGINIPGRSDGGQGNILHQMLTYDNGLKVVESANQVALNGLAQHDLLASALQDPSNTLPIPWSKTGPLADQLKFVAQLIHASSSLDSACTRQIFFVSHGGYDSHSNQRDQAGGQDTRLQEFNDGMKAFHDVMVALGLDSQVTTFTNSEFGRTLQQSGTGGGAGSDHAWGNHHLIMGGAVKGGDIYGTFPSLIVGGPDDMTPLSNNFSVTPRGTMIPTTSAAQYGASLAKWFGVPTDKLGLIFDNLGNFPGGSDLGFMKTT